MHGAGTAKAETPQIAVATGAADVLALTIDAGVVKVEIDAARSTTTARATGVAPTSPGGSTASTTCTIANIKVVTPLLTLPIPGPACNGASLINLPGIVTITAPNATSSATATEATAEVTPLTISVLGATVQVELGRSFAHARLSHAPAQDLCRPPESPTASGHARGDVVQIKAVDPVVSGLATTDVVLSQASIDEAGIDDDGTPTAKAAESDGWIVRQQVHSSPLPPNVTDRTEVGVFHARATAPPNQSQDHAGLPPGAPGDGPHQRHGVDCASRGQDRPLRGCQRHHEPPAAGDPGAARPRRPDRRERRHVRPTPERRRRPRATPAWRTSTSTCWVAR